MPDIYVKLPDDSYGRFAEGTPDATIKAAILKDFPNAFGAPQAPATFTKTAVPQATPEKVLAEENRPLQSGFGTMVGEAGSGISEMGQEGVLSKVMGLLRTINAPATGAGDVIGTGVHNILANIPGLGGASGVIPAAGAAGANAVTQLLSGPQMIKSAIGGGKELIKGAGKILAPNIVSEAGQEAAMKTLGAVTPTIERVFAEPASKAKYLLAENSGPVATDPLRQIVENAFNSEAFGMASPSKKALSVLSDLEQFFSQGTKMAYGKIMDNVQRLKAEADAALTGVRSNPALAKVLNNAREEILDELDKVNPAYRQANKLYRQEQATIDFAKALRTATPGAAIENMIEADVGIAKVFSKKQISEVLQIAKQLNTVASGRPVGEIKQIIAPIAEGIAKMLGANTSAGRVILGNVLKETTGQMGKINPERLTMAVQAWRAGQKIKGEY